MVYREFDTENARYMLQLMDHDLMDNFRSAASNGGVSKASGIDLDLFDSVDGLVIEEAGGDLLDTLQRFKKSTNPIFNLGYLPYQVVEKALQRQIPFYCTDVPLKGDMWRKGENERVPLKSRLAYALGAALWEVYGVNPTEELPDSASRWMSRLSYWEMDPLLEGRNAVNAEKIERGVVPRLRQRSGKDKPLIGLVYGFMHTGLEQNLQSPKRRQKVIRKMRKLDEFDPSQFNIVDEAIYHPEEKRVTVERFDARVF